MVEMRRPEAYAAQPQAELVYRWQIGPSDQEAFFEAAYETLAKISAIKFPEPMRPRLLQPVISPHGRVWELRIELDSFADIGSIVFAVFSAPYKSTADPGEPGGKSKISDDDSAGVRSVPAGAAGESPVEAPVHATREDPAMTAMYDVLASLVDLPGELLTDHAPIFRVWTAPSEQEATDVDHAAP